MILCLPLVSVLVIAGFELKSGEAATMRGHCGRGFLLRASRSASNLLISRASIPDIAVSSFYFVDKLSVYGRCTVAGAFNFHIAWQLT